MHNMICLVALLVLASVFAGADKAEVKGMITADWRERYVGFHRKRCRGPHR